MLAQPDRIPRATYRLQLNSNFPFAAATALVPYLKRLGISDLYASPILQASTGSSHGYDVNDFNRVSMDLGGREGLERLSTALHDAGLGFLVDFVPNHMGIDGTHNYWWHHVLENGAESKYAPYFDIEWHPRLDRLNNRVLVPILVEHYGTVLEKGELSLQYEEGQFYFRYGPRKLPASPETYALILDQVELLLDSDDARKTSVREWSDAFASLPSLKPDECDQQLATLKQEFVAGVGADPILRDLLEKALKAINGNPRDPLSFESLHKILERQHYRLAHWKVGAHEVNYRRFFAIDTLIGLRMENAEVFAASHALLRELIDQRIISGIRLDHIDGLWDPAQYLERLRDLVASQREGKALYTLVEKILAPGEDVPKSWAIHGTTGYEFISQLGELFLDRADEKAWTTTYENFIGEAGRSLDLTYQDKLFILQEMFPNAVANLATELDTLIEADWRWRDLSLHDLKTGLRHLLACLTVYRTYRIPGETMEPGEKDRIARAVEEAVRRNPCLDPLAVRFIGRVITGDYPDPGDYLGQLHAFENWVCKLQQVTGAIMAKSVEDTHFYRYVRLLGANEVGGHPSRFGEPVNAFHTANLKRQKESPLCMLTTSTHDTKMSEDARARLYALAELPEEWDKNIRTWHHINGSAHQEVEGRMAPDAREEYLLYQALLAAWPLGMTEVDEEFGQRMKAYFRKAQGEAKLNTSWTYPHVKWHTAGEQFIDTILKSSKFLESFLPFARRIALRGMIISLAQTALKLTSPGIPDLYQGNELWDFSLVDPDNRRPVNYKIRDEILAGLEKRSPSELLENWQDGAIKLLITHALLQYRSTCPEVFQKGEYIPLQLQGKKAEQAVAFARKSDAMELLVVVPRRLGPDDNSWLGPFWEDTKLIYPRPYLWKSIITGHKIDDGAGDLALSCLCADLPLAVLVSQ